MSPLDFRKVFYHTENLLELKETGDSWPIAIKLGITTFCNHRCIFCQGGHSAADDNAVKSAIIDFDVLLSCLKQARAHGLKAVTICGLGEPLMYPHIDKLFEEMRKLGIEIGLFSNGALLNERRRKFIAEYATWIRLSINGSNVEEHNKVHQCKGDFSRIIENIRSLIALRKQNRGGCLPLELKWLYMKIIINRFMRRQNFGKILALIILKLSLYCQQNLI